MRNLNASSIVRSDPSDDWLTARHTQPCAAQSDNARLERLRALQTSLPRLTVPGLELVGRLLAGLRAGNMSESELQSHLWTNRALIGDSWVHHMRALHARFAQTATYSAVDCAPASARMRTHCRASADATETDVQMELQIEMPTEAVEVEALLLQIRVDMAAALGVDVSQVADVTIELAEPEPEDAPAVRAVAGTSYSVQYTWHICQYMNYIRC